MASASATSDQLHDRGSEIFAGPWAKFWLLLLAAGLPMLYPYLTELWHQEHYRYFPLSIVVVGYLVHMRWDRQFHPPRSWWGWCAICFGVLAIALAAVTAYPWFAAFGFVLIATCCLSAMRGPFDRSLLGVAVPLWMLVKLPFRIDRTVIAELQGITTTLSSVLLDLLSVPHTTLGNVVKLSKHELFVAEACSGVQSVFTLAFAACVLVSIYRLRLWLLSIYLTAAVALALAANVLRVSLIAVARAWYDVDLSSGWMHDAVGYLCLAAAIGLLISFDRMAAIIFHDVGSQDVSVDSNPFSRMWNWIAVGRKTEDSESELQDTPRSILERKGQGLLGRLTGMVVVRSGFVAVIAIVVTASVVSIYASRPRQIAVGNDALLFDPPADLLQNNQGRLQITDYAKERGGKDARLGKNADIWTCGTEDGSLKAQLVLSQSYSGWKELCVCYEGRDWNLVDRSIERHEDENGGAGESPDSSFAVGRFRAPTGENAYLYFSAIRPDGTIMPALTGVGALANRFTHRFDMTGVWQLDDVMMLQLWIVSEDKLSPEAVNQLKAGFVDFRATIAEAAGSRQAGSLASDD